MATPLTHTTIETALFELGDEVGFLSVSEREILVYRGELRIFLNRNENSSWSAHPAHLKDGPRVDSEVALLKAIEKLLS